MKDKIEDVIDHLCDSVRYYSICRGCLGEVELSGIGNPPISVAFRVL